MALDSVILPALSGSPGQSMAAYKLAGAGPSGSDLEFEVNVSQPENGVGRRLVEVVYTVIPSSPTAVSSTDIAIGNVYIYNSTTGYLNITIDDGQISAKPILSQAVPPGPFPQTFSGLHFAGWRWSGQSGLYVALRGWTA